MTKMIEKLKEHFQNTSVEEQKKNWEGVSKYSNVGPKASEVVKEIKNKKNNE